MSSLLCGKERECSTVVFSLLFWASTQMPRLCIFMLCEAAPVCMGGWCPSSLHSPWGLQDPTLLQPGWLGFRCPSWGTRIHSQPLTFPDSCSQPGMGKKEVGLGVSSPPLPFRPHSPSTFPPLTWATPHHLLEGLDFGQHFFKGLIQ